MHQSVGPAKMTRHGQHHAERLFRDSYGVGPRRIHHRDALTRRGIEIDVVHAYACPAYHAQFFRMRKQRRIRLHGRAHDQRVGSLQFRCQFAVKLLGGKHSPSGFFQLFHRRSGNFLRNKNFHDVRVPSLWSTQMNSNSGRT